VNPLFRYLNKNKIAFGIIMCLLGLTIGLFGKRMFKTAICMTTTLAITLSLSLFLFTIFLTRNSSATSEWIVFGVSGAIGLCIGIILAMFFKCGIALVAAWGGFCIGLILYNAFMYKVDNDSKVAFWCTCVSLAVIAALLALKLMNHALILGTSIAGAYALVRGISCFTPEGSYPDEMELYYLIKMG
jgi:hypothetical protein